MLKLTDEEKEKGAEERLDSIASEPLQDHPIPEDLLEKLRKEGRL